MLEVLPGQSVYVGAGDGGVASVAKVPVAKVVGQEEDNVWGPSGQGGKGGQGGQGQEGGDAGDWQEGQHVEDWQGECSFSWTTFTFPQETGWVLGSTLP